MRQHKKIVDDAIYFNFTHQKKKKVLEKSITWAIFAEFFSFSSSTNLEFVMKCQFETIKNIFSVAYCQGLWAFWHGFEV